MISDFLEGAISINDPPLHVLLVEDDDAHAMMVEKGFRAADKNGTIDRVCDGLEAIAYVKRQGEYRKRPRPNVILLDLKLPRMDGHGVLRALKADDELKSIPVVVLTTSDADKDVGETYRLHANSYLVKPANFVQFRELIGAVTIVLGRLESATSGSRKLRFRRGGHRQGADLACRRLDQPTDGQAGTSNVAAAAPARR